MRFSNTILLALPLLAASEGAFEQYRAQFENFIGSLTGAGSKPSTQQAEVPQPATTQYGQKVHYLTLDNWRDTLYSPVKPGATTPEEWWVLITGGNKTCFGHCLTVQAAFNESVTKVAKTSKPIHLGYLDCENNRVLCNSWSAGPNTLWVFEMLPPPANIDIYLKRLNSTTTTSKDILELESQGHKDNFHLHDGYFHPFDGPLARNGLAVPIGYMFHFFNVVPSWLTMLVISFISRSMMNRRMNKQEAARAQAARAAAPAGGAPAGGAPAAAPRT